MKYIDYKGMKEFYTIEEICRLLEIDKQTLKAYSEKYGFEPSEDLFGNWGFTKKELRKLHHLIYEEQKTSGAGPSRNVSVKKGPWDD